MKDFERGYEVVKRIKKLKEGMHGNLQRLFKDMNLTGPQGMVVGIVFRSGPLKIGEISTQMGLSMSTVSGILDRLERSNIVKREKSEEDGRVFIVDLTDEFRQSSSETFCKIEKHWGEKLSIASEEEIEAILNGLEILERLLLDVQD